MSDGNDTVETFPRPPFAFEDGADREIAVRSYGDGPDDDEFEALVSMYGDFDPADRAQGLPPGQEPALREWLDALLVDEAVNVVAWHGGAVAGHATLVEDDQGAIDSTDDPPHELAIFVHQDYQGAGVGTSLVRGLLGAGEERGVGRVWLTVERWNEPAIALYRGVGFETTNAERFEMEMTLDLGER